MHYAYNRHYNIYTTNQAFNLNMNLDNPNTRETNMEETKSQSPNSNSYPKISLIPIPNLTMSQIPKHLIITHLKFPS